MRVPAIAWWPYKIRHGRTHQLAATLDILPTIYSIVDAELPEDVQLDGVDLSSVLFNKAGKVGVVIGCYHSVYLSSTYSTLNNYCQVLL